ncbi:hypothetical protein VP141O351_P0095 [Vibrio phage 141O35-1]|nr:hypothetical protein VP141O351_P0095 [Vibrio phage 141O35-1]CAH9016469.1 hypothetical protein VP141E351_P0095 [Vibrio phage 141E35-1]
MSTPGGLVDKQELIDAQLDTAHLGRVVNSKDASGAPINTSTNRTGGVNKTLDALEAEYQGDIDNFVQVSDQVIIDKTDEFNEAIQGAGGIPLGTWAAGVTTFTKYNEYAVYNGIPYKPRTTTTLPYVAQGSDPTASPDGANVQPYQEITEAQVVDVVESTVPVVLPDYTDIVYGSIADMISGNPLQAQNGNKISTSGTSYEVNTSKGIPLDNGLFAWPMSPISFLDAGASMNPADDSTSAFEDLLIYAKQSNKSIYLPETGIVANWYTINGEHEIEGLTISGGGNQNTLITTTDTSGSLLKGTGAKKTLFRTQLSKFRINGPGKASDRVGVDGELFSSFIELCGFTNLGEGLRLTGCCEGISKNFIQENGTGIRIVPEYDTLQPATTIGMHQNWVKGNDVGVHVDHVYDANPVWPQCASFGGAVDIMDSNTYQENGTGIWCNRSNSYFGVAPIYFEKNTIAWNFIESSVNFLGIAEFEPGIKYNNQSAIADKFKGRVEMAGNRNYMRQLTSTVPTDSPASVLSFTHENDETNGLYFDQQNKCGFAGHSFSDPRKGEQPAGPGIVDGFSVWNRNYSGVGDGVRLRLDHGGAFPGNQNRGAFMETISTTAFGETCEVSFGNSFAGTYVKQLTLSGGNSGGAVVNAYLGITNQINGAAAPNQSFFVNGSGVLQYKDSTGVIKTVNLT